MWPDQVSNQGPLTYESGALPTALRDPAFGSERVNIYLYSKNATSPGCFIELLGTKDTQILMHYK